MRVYHRGLKKTSLAGHQSQYKVSNFGHESPSAAALLEQILNGTIALEASSSSQLIMEAICLPPPAPS